MSTIRKRRGRYQVQIRRKGVSLTRTFARKQNADSWTRKQEAAIDAGTLTAQTTQTAQGEATLFNALNRYKREVSPTKKSARFEIVRLERIVNNQELADRPIEAITATDIAQWRDRRLAQVQHASVRREFNLLQSVFAKAMKEWGWLSESPMQGVQRPPDSQPRDVLISDTQRDAVFAAAGYARGCPCVYKKQIVGACFDFALETTFRAGEIVRMQWGDIDWANQTVYLRDTKNGESRVAPLSTGAIAILSAMTGERPFDITSASLSALFRKIAGSAGLGGAFTFHDARATALSRLSARLNVMELARVSGHHDIGILYRRYYRVPIAEIAQKLG